MNHSASALQHLSLFVHALCRKNRFGWFPVWITLLLGSSAVYADVVVNEIMYNPKTDGEDGEYVELYNTAETPVDLSGWVLSGGINFTFPSGTLLQGQSYLVVCRNEQFIRTRYQLTSLSATVGNYAPTRLSNSGEEIRLENLGGQTVDEVSYSDNAPWPTAADGGGASLELVHPLADNTNVAYWSAGTAPTPGSVNSRSVSLVPPVLQTLVRRPQSPSAQDAVTVEARFANEDQLPDVSLIYQVNGIDLKTLPMTLQNGAYAAVIPAQAAGSRVEYWVSAQNATGYRIDFPAGTFESRYLYVVDSPVVASGSVVIHEIMYNNPSAQDEDKEWIELYNPSNQAVNLSDWIVQDANERHGYRLPVGTQLAPQGYLLIAHTKETAWTAPTVTGLSFSLGDDGDEIRLLDPNQRLIASVEFEDSGAWPAGADGQGRSLELLQPARPNEESNNWAVSVLGGTPGRPNSAAVADPAYHDYDIVINELFYHPGDEEYDGNIEKEYIELYNRGTQAVNLGGWFFSTGVEYLFPQGTVLPGGGYLLVCKNKSQYAEVPNRIGNYALQLSNGGEAVALTNDAGVVIDHVPYRDNFPWPAMPDGRGVSLELIAPGADNSVAQVWRNGQPGSPGRPNAVLRPGAPPRITNVRHTPEFPFGTSDEPRVETQTLIKRGDNWRYFKGTQEPPAAWKSIGFSDSAWPQGPSGFGYDDGDDNTVLDDMRGNYTSLYIRRTFSLSQVTAGSNLVLVVDYDDGYVAYLNGQEVSRSANLNGQGDPPAHDQITTGGHDAGSPDIVDISQYANLLKTGENVLAVQGHNLHLSTSGDFSLAPELVLARVITGEEKDVDRIVLSAQVQDADGVGEVLLHYQRLIAPLGTGLVLGDWVSVPMVDDGTHGDLLAGDSVYSFALNDAETIKPNEVWRYRISAKDTAGEETTLPLQDEEVRNFSLFVQNRNERSPYPTTHLFMEQSVYNGLLRNPETDVEQPCILVMDGEVFDLYHGGGARFRGNTLRNKPKKSWKIQFAKGQSWHNQTTINLNSNYQTSPLVRGESGYMEHLAYQLFRETGLPTAESHHRRLVLNNGYYGLFIQIEQYNDDFLDNHDLPKETHIYKAGIKAVPSYMSREPGFDAYAKKYENAIGRAHDIQELIDLIENMYDATDLKAFFEANADVDAYLNYLASLAVLSHVDATEKNYFPIRRPDGRWFMLPWDISHAWGEMFDLNSFPFKADYSLLDGAEGGKFGTNYFRQKFLRVPEFRKRYYERLRDFTDHIFTHEHWDPIFDAYWNYLKEAVSEDSSRWDSPGQLQSMVAEMKKYITARRAFILADANVLPANRPAKPVNDSPAGGGTVSARSFRLAVRNTAAGPFAAAQWEIQAGSNDFAKPLWVHEIPADALPGVDVPADVVAPGVTYYWRMRWKANAADAWSEWSAPTAFQTAAGLPAPDVQHATATALDGSVRLEWDLPVAADLLRVDIYNGTTLVESAPAADNRVRITGLQNGQEYTFTVKTVTVDRQVSPGVTVKATPRASLQPGQTLAYFRFENEAQDESGLFTGELLGGAAMGGPGLENPVAGTGASNQASLNLQGSSGGGFRFGSTEPELDIEDELTVECYVLMTGAAEQPVVLMDRYDESAAETEGVWRFGLGLSSPGSIDFFFNDADSNSGLGGRLHIATYARVIPDDNKAHHFAAVVDLDKRSLIEKVSLYLDGHVMKKVLVNEDGVSDYDRLRTGSDWPILLGAKKTAAGTGAMVPGRIDEARLVHAALEPTQFLRPPDPATPMQDWVLY